MTLEKSEIRHLRSTIGRNIQEYRMTRKVTLKKLSRETGIGIARLDGFEMGKYEIRLDHLLIIAKTLKTDIRSFFEDHSPS